jgi:hypothetical protein
MSVLGLSFHESTVVAFHGTKPFVCLELADVRSGERLVSAEIDIRDVEAIWVDREPADAVMMECPDGEVLTLDLREKDVQVIVQWNDFASRRSITRSYVIRGTPSVRLSVV